MIPFTLSLQRPPGRLGQTDPPRTALPIPGFCLRLVFWPCTSEAPGKEAEMGG